MQLTEKILMPFQRWALILFSDSISRCWIKYKDNYFDIMLRVLLLLFSLNWFSAKCQVVDTFWIGKPNSAAIVYGEVCYYLSDTIASKATNYPINIISPVKSVWKFKGTIDYEYSFRSRIDSPFAELDLQRHTIRTRFDVKGPLPISVVAAYSNGNSALYPPLFSVSIFYDNQLHANELKRDAISIAKKSIETKNGLEQKVNSLRQLENEIAELSSFIESQGFAITRDELKLYATAILGQLRENKRDAVISMLSDENNKIDSILSMLLAGKTIQQLDTLSARLNQINNRLKDLNLNYTFKDFSIEKIDLLNGFNAKLDKFEKLKLQRDLLDRSVAQIKRSVVDSIGSIEKEIAAKSTREIKTLMLKYDDTTTVSQFRKNVFFDWIADFERVSVGRQTISLSELSVSNWAFTGIGFKRSRDIRLEFGAGVSTNRLRGIWTPNIPTPAIRGPLHLPSSWIASAKLGLLRLSNFDLSLIGFVGRQSWIYQITNTTKDRGVPILGWSFLGRWTISNIHRIEIEFAKSGQADRFNQVGNSGVKGGYSGIVNFGLRSNEAIRMSYAGDYNKFGAKLLGTFSKLGHEYVSFAFYPTLSKRVAYNVQLEKWMWKRRVVLAAGVLRNQFRYPYLRQLRSNNTSFTFRAEGSTRTGISGSISYIPSSQLVVLDSGAVAEYQFQTLVSSLSYMRILKSWTVLGVISASAVMLPEGNGITLFALNSNHLSLLLNAQHKNIGIGMGWQYAQLGHKVLSTLELQGQYKLKSGWSASMAGRIYNLVNDSIYQGKEFGYKVSVTSPVFRWGGRFMLQLERQFLPFYGLQSFQPVTIGNLTFSKTF